MSQEIQLVEGTLIDLDEGGAPAVSSGGGVEWSDGDCLSSDIANIRTQEYQSGSGGGGGGGGYSEGDEDLCTDKNHLLSSSHMDSESIDRESEPLLARETTDVTLSVPGTYERKRKY